MDQLKGQGFKENGFAGKGGKSSSRSRQWANLFFFSLSLNLAMFTTYIYQHHHSSTTSALVSAPVSSIASQRFDKETANHDMGSLHEPESESRISSGRTLGADELAPDAVINLDHGDPTMYEAFWKNASDRSEIVIKGWQTMSYFSDVRNVCWFLEPDFAGELKKLHQLVGNAETEGAHIVVGTGSTQLFQAALFALSPPDLPEPMSVVSPMPYYSSYPLVTDYLKSTLYKWAGDAHAFQRDSPYIELVTSPNNPDGSIREAVVNRVGGRIIHDLAYYWPQYTPITYKADHDIMLFTVSKSTGHAGTRIGWAVVKDKDVAARMVKFIELNTIGVSKDSQIRAGRILRTVREGYEGEGTQSLIYRLFDFGYEHMNDRWARLRAAVKQSSVFSLPEYPSGICHFTGETRTSHPAFAWLKCEREIEDCEEFLKEKKMLTRGGKHFGAGRKFVRVSMLDRDAAFDLFVQRVASISM